MLKKCKKKIKKKGKALMILYYKQFLGEERRGGSKGGSANTDTQFAARQMVGKTYGRQTGIKNQSELTKAYLTKYAIWEYSGCKDQTVFYAGKNKNFLLCPENSTEEHFYILLKPKEAIIDQMRILSLFTPGSIPMQSVSSMYKLIRKEGQGNTLYGWSLFKTLTRSEVDDGKLNDLSVEFLMEDMIPE